MNKRHKSSGFTIVETLAAGFVLAISAIVISKSLSQTFESLQLSKDYQKAAELLDLTLTKIDMIGPERLLHDGPAKGQFDDRFAWEAEIESLPDGHLYLVQVRIIWKGLKTQRSIVAKTYLNDSPKSRLMDFDWKDI